VEDTQRTVERVARESYGRLLAFLSAGTRDVAGAEDALGDALLAALTSWPDSGIPDQPEAWLLAAARHRLIDQARRARVRASHDETVGRLAAASVASASAPAEAFPDRRADLLFVCAHPAIDASLHTPLMLQTVLGLDAARIARAFLVPPATMGQRLVRAKRKIREAGVPFEVPPAHELRTRLDAVLEAVYAAFGVGLDDAAGIDPRGHGLVLEAIWLARVLRERLPGEPEVRGLLALMLHCHARRDAQRDPDGSYVPLSEQDPAKWDAGAVREAESELMEATRLGGSGRFQTEAAIQSVHTDRARSGRTDWPAIVVFYEHLAGVSPTLGALVARAAAVAEHRGAAAGLALLDAIDGASVTGYQPYWAVRAHILRSLDRATDARDAYDRAIGLAEDPAIRRFLIARRV
jgi:RNA polymerase sigma-70 factor (ECF subfamily)